MSEDKKAMKKGDWSEMRQDIKKLVDTGFPPRGIFWHYHKKYSDHDGYDPHKLVQMVDKCASGGGE